MTYLNVNAFLKVFKTYGKGIKNCPNYWMEESGSSFSIAREACLHEYKGIGNLN